MEYLFFAGIIFLGCSYYAIKTMIEVSQYRTRKENCTKMVNVTVESVREYKERMYLSETNIWYIYTFRDCENPTLRYHNAYAKCPHYLLQGKTVTILVNPRNPGEFFYPGEAEPRKTDGILCGIMAVLMLLAMFMVINHDRL